MTHMRKRATRLLLTLSVFGVLCTDRSLVTSHPGPPVTIAGAGWSLVRHWVGRWPLALECAYADVPYLINYQGRLTDASGKSVAGSMSLIFRLYDAETSGTELWKESQTVSLTSADNGLFNVILGSSKPFTGLSFNSSMWLSVQVSGDVEMSPRQRLTATGYAINASTLNGVKSDSFLRSDIDTSASGKLTLTRSGTAFLVKPTTDPAVDTTLVDIQNAAGTSKFSVDLEGDTTIAGNLTVSGTMSGATSTTGTTSSSWDIGSGTDATSNNVSLLFGQTSGQRSLVYQGASTGDFIFNDDVRLDAQSALKLVASSGSNFVGFKAPSSISSSVTWTLPSADGSNNYVLKTNGSGTLAWADPSTLTSVGDVTDVGDCASGACFSSSGSGTALTFRNATSGTVALQTVSGALGSQTISLPASTGTVITTGNLSSITTTGTITSGTWNGSAIGAQYGGTGLNSSSSTGVPTLSSGTWSVSSALGVSLGGTGAAPSADDQALIADSTSAATWRALPNCTDSSGSHLNYTTVTNSFSCGTSSSTSSLAFSALTSGTNTQAAMVVGSLASLDYTGTGTINATTFKGNSRVAAADGGTGITTSASTGIPSISSGTWSVIGTTGSGSAVLATSPTVTTPTISGNITYTGTQPLRTAVLTAAGAIVGISSNATQKQTNGMNFSYYTLNFDKDLVQRAYWQFTVPTSYTGTTISVQIFWIANATTGDVKWQVATDSKTSGQAWDSALSTASTSTVTTTGTANNVNVTTINNVTSGWAADEPVMFELQRIANDAADTLAVDAQVLQVKIKWTAATESD